LRVTALGLTLVDGAGGNERVALQRAAPVDDGVALAHVAQVVHELEDARVLDLDLVCVDGWNGKAGAGQQIGHVACVWEPASQ
jgi:hypothetical protein